MIRREGGRLPVLSFAFLSRHPSPPEESSCGPQNAPGTIWLTTRPSFRQFPESAPSCDRLNEPAGAAVYQLGQFGTAAKKLEEWDLRR